MKVKKAYKYIAGLIVCAIAASAVNAFAYDRRTPIVEAVEKVLPSVVDILTTKDVKVSTFPFRSSFFRTPMDDLFVETYSLKNLGSGCVIEGGYVITNYHVISYDFGPADKIFVTVYGEKDLREATIIGGDPYQEVAILRIEGPHPEHYLPWGESDDLMVGETVIAIGSALGQPFTVTNGIISALNRTIEGKNERPLTNLIQTNADINRGNSGGPLVNINGEFIGLNTVILSPSGGSVGLGFAIPVSRIKRIYDYWVKGILLLEDQMGLEIQDLTQHIERFFRTYYPSLKEEDLTGIVVVQVSPSGLSAGKLKKRDLIVRVNGNPISDSRDFQSRLEEHQGNDLSLEIIREGQRETITIPVSQRKVEKISWQGMEFQALDNPWRNRLEISEGQEGVVILSVDPDSAAAKAKIVSNYPNYAANHAGIQRGDIILSLNKKYVVNSLDDMKEIKRALAHSDTIVIELARRVDKGLLRLFFQFKNSQSL